MKKLFNFEIKHLLRSSKGRSNKDITYVGKYNIIYLMLFQEWKYSLQRLLIFINVNNHKSQSYNSWFQFIENIFKNKISLNLFTYPKYKKSN